MEVVVPPGPDWSSSPLQVEPPLYTQGRAESLGKIIQRDSIKGLNLVPQCADKTVNLDGCVTYDVNYPFIVNGI